MKVFDNEKLKTIILTFLVLCSMMLTYRLWFQDHNLFSMLGKLVETKKFFTQNNLEHVFSHPNILINFGDNSHAVVNPSQQEYVNLKKEGVNILKKALLSSKYEIVDSNSWNQLLSSKSLRFGYQTDIPSELILNLRNITNQNIQDNIKYFRDMVIVIDNSVSENIKCYIKNESQDKVFVFKFRYDADNLEDLMLGVMSKGYDNYVTGFEVKHKLLKDDVLILPTDAILYGTKIKLTNEININSSNDIKDISQKIFSKSNIVKHVDYLDESKTKVVMREFIDRKNILKLYTNGKLEYSSADIPNYKSSSNIYDALKTAVGFIDSNLGFPQNSYISDIKMESGNRYVFSFDYFINGLNVKIVEEDGTPSHAITVEIIGDKVVNYKRNVKKFKLENKVELNVLNLKAIDKAITQYSIQTGNKNDEKLINDVQLVYNYNLTLSEIYPSWYVRVDDKEFFIKTFDEEE